MKNLAAIGMCNALYDIQVEISEDEFANLGFPKGSMNLVDHESQRRLVSLTYDKIVNTASGGSGANTMYGLSLLGSKCAYISKVGPDEHGHLYRLGLEKTGVTPLLATGTSDTGICLVVITPDAERTMFTYLGEARNLTDSDLPLSELARAEYLYVTGYLWDTPGQKAAVKLAMETAQSAGAKVAFSLSDSFCVDRHRDDFLNLIESHVAIVFGNLAEGQLLTGAQNPDEIVAHLAPKVDTVILTLGDKGSLLFHQGEQVTIPPYETHSVDATGAGDMFAAGVLYGLSKGLSLEKTGHIASLTAAQVVGQLGPRLDKLDLTNLKV